MWNLAHDLIDNMTEEQRREMDARINHPYHYFRYNIMRNHQRLRQDASIFSEPPEEQQTTKCDTPHY